MTDELNRKQRAAWLPLRTTVGPLKSMSLFDDIPRVLIPQAELGRVFIPDGTLERCLFL